MPPIRSGRFTTRATSVVTGVGQIIDRALTQLRATSTTSLLDERKLGRAGLPTTDEIAVQS